MRSFLSALSVTVLAGALVMAASGAAQAATGKVVVFKTEVERLATFENPPDGACYPLPGTSHVLLNQTDSVVTIHSDPGCMFPVIPVQPDHGWHAPASGITGPFSFSVD